MINDVEEFRAYIVHMISEHRRLHEAVQTIEQRWRLVDMEAASEDTVTELVAGLEQLRNELRHHFAEEESGGCIEEAVTRCPSLSQDAARIEHEHVSLLDQLGQIVEQLRQVCVDASLANASHCAFEDFVKRLHAHETAENEILEQGFGIQ